MREIIGRKIGMTQVFANNGKMYPVTVVEVLPNVVTQVKTLEKDGYAAVQVGYEDQKESRLNKPERGIYAKAKVAPHAHLRELKGDIASLNVGDSIRIEDVFKAGDVIDVIGTSKGKGYTGVIKGYHFKIGPKGHGSGYHRGAGSMGVNGLGVNRIMPGKKMSGHMGNEQVTLLNLIVVQVLPEKNAILIKGSIPGPKLSLVRIRNAVKVQLGHPELIEELVNRTPVVEEIAAEVITEEAPASIEVAEATEALETPVEVTEEVIVETAETPVEANEEIATETVETKEE